MRFNVMGVSRLAGYLGAGIFALSLTIPALGQGRAPTGPPAGAGQAPSIKNIKSAEHVRRANEARLRSVGMDAGTAAEDQKHIQEAIGHMKQDFTRIQVLRNDIARSLVAHNPLDYKLIREQTGEISRRTHRLNVYMLAHAPEDKDHKGPSELKGDEMIDALVRLCKLIDSFTENPALKNAAMVDSREVGKAKEEKARADRDLLAIIKLSERIHKRSDSLREHQ